MQEACLLNMQCAQQMATHAEKPTNVAKEGTFFERAVAAADIFNRHSTEWSGDPQFIPPPAIAACPPGTSDIFFDTFPQLHPFCHWTVPGTDRLLWTPETDAASESGATLTPADAAAEVSNTRGNNDNPNLF